MADLKMNIENCAKALAKANAEWSEINQRKQAVDREMTTAINKLNEAQKSFDEAVNELRANAPWNSDWHSQRKQRVAA